MIEVAYACALYPLAGLQIAQRLAQTVLNSAVHRQAATTPPRASTSVR
ncbi:hypothetical protein AB0L42_37935 [Streptomyces sp. NPDC052287]